MGEQVDSELLRLESMTGFCGAVPSGLIIHPDRNHMLYPVGCTVVIENLSSKKQEFLSGHTNNVSCLAVSKSGRYVASGQITHMGFKADVKIWDFERRALHRTLTLHMVKVEALAFSPNDLYLVTLGGEDDGSVVVWNVQTGDAICGSPAQVSSAGMTHTVCYANTNDNVFVTGGADTLRVWKLNVNDRKIVPTPVNMGQLKRIVKCIVMDPEDGYFYCGTTTGDLLLVNMSSHNFQLQSKKRFSLGITSLVLLKTGELIVGAGDGTVAVVKGRDGELKTTEKIMKLEGDKAGEVTSVTLRGGGHQFFVGTARGSIYRFNLSEIKTPTLLNTAHDARINDVCFPYGTGQLFVTCAYQDIRVWTRDVGMKSEHSGKATEVLRIVVPNLTCNAVELTRDGSAIISGWDDGIIRGFYPESGKPMYKIENAHGGGVTALNLLSDRDRIVSGGKEGGVRVWKLVSCNMNKKVPQFEWRMEFALKEHKAQVTAIKVRKQMDQCVTSSLDGSCIIWDLLNRCRLQMIRSNSLFQFVCYHPSEHQIIVTGTDRKIGYYETFDSSTVREIDGSKSGAINCLDITADGRKFVSAGDDKLVKVFDYDGGNEIRIGIGHSAPITRVKISPCESYIISVSSDGAILCWEMPH